MPRFFLHLLECGTLYPDQEGVDADSLQVALRRAIEGARDIMCDEVAKGRLCLSCCIVIEDESRSEVARVPFREALTITGLKAV